MGYRVHCKLMCAHHVECYGNSLRYRLMSPHTCEHKGWWCCKHVCTSTYANILSQRNSSSLDEVRNWEMVTWPCSLLATFDTQREVGAAMEALQELGGGIQVGKPEYGQ